MLLALTGIGGTATAQVAKNRPDSTTIVAGARYRSPPLPAWLLGTSYRDLWSDSIRVPILDLERTAGGLTVLRLGGGRQSTSLRFTGADGREYAFRSVDKTPARADSPEMAGRLSGRILHDQISSLVPAAPVLAARLSEAAGVFYSEPRIYVLPDSPLLGEHREAFAGTLGTFEEHPNEIDRDTPGFGGFELIVGTDELLEKLDERPLSRVDAEGYLNARLTDFILGDWDRRGDQWRWALTGPPEARVWLPIARDRDFAMSDYDGALLHAVRFFTRNAVRFTADYRDLPGLTANARPLDSWILAPLDRTAWDSIATALASRITDADIEEAVRTLPREYVAARGDAFAATLRARRDRVREAAEAYYRELARVPPIFATDANDDAAIVRHPDGSVSVRVTTREGDRERVTFDRRFDPADTREIRVFLRGGDDRASVTGIGDRGIIVRIVGGDGSDTLSDSSYVNARGSWTSLHGDSGDDLLLGHARTDIDRGTLTEPEPLDEGVPPMAFDDAGSAASWRPVADYSTTVGPTIGARFSYVTRAFRDVPYRSRVRLDLEYGPRWGRIGLTGGFDYHPRGSASRAEIELTATGLDAFRFYGFGNDTDAPLRSREYVVRPDVLGGHATLYREIGSGTEVGIGAAGRYARYHAPTASPFDLLVGTGTTIAHLGARALIQKPAPEAIEIDRPWLEGIATASISPLVTGPAGTFGSIDGRVEGVHPLNRSGRLRATGRLGGRYVAGDYPVEEAAFLGGSETLRGYPRWRFAGDATVYGTAGLITRVGRFPLLFNWEVDALAFADAGRVFLSGEDSSIWHAAPGLGVTLSIPFVTLEFTWAHGSGNRFYVDADVNF
jgi:hypothetical protein